MPVDVMKHQGSNRIMISSESIPKRNGTAWKILVLLKHVNTFLCNLNIYLFENIKTYLSRSSKSTQVYTVISTQVLNLVKKSEELISNLCNINIQTMLKLKNIKMHTYIYLHYIYFNCGKNMSKTVGIALVSYTEHQENICSKHIYLHPF